jgi:hypothetical protein
VSWQFQISLFLAPVVLYGLMMLGQRFPKSEASSSGVSYRDMLGELGLVGAAVICGLLALFFKSDLGLPPLVAGGIAAALLVAFGAATGFRFGHLLLAALLLVHAMVGYVELGTDSWISKITGTIMNSPANGLLLFVYTSGLMFVLRFFAGPIVERISPLGLLAASALFGAVGLTLLGNAQGGLMCVIAATVYGIGKTFLWPTMLAVVSEQFPKGGAITIGAAGGVGMLAAGLLGGSLAFWLGQRHGRDPWPPRCQRDRDAHHQPPRVALSRWARTSHSSRSCRRATRRRTRPCRYCVGEPTQHHRHAH